MRPGTLPTELIAGLGMAAEIAAGRIDDDLAHLSKLRDALWDGIRDIDGVTLNGDPNGFPGILNVSVDDIEGESLLLALEPLLVATGSACNSKSQEPSYVLRALGRTDLQAQSAIRFSVGRPTTMAEVEFAAGHYRAAVEKTARAGAGGCRMSADPYSARVRELFADTRMPATWLVRKPSPSGSGRPDSAVRCSAGWNRDGHAFSGLGLSAPDCGEPRRPALPLRGRPLPGSNVDSADLMQDLPVPVEKTGRILVLEDAVRSLGQRFATEPELNPHR